MSPERLEKVESLRHDEADTSFIDMAEGRAPVRVEAPNVAPEQTQTETAEIERIRTNLVGRAETATPPEKTLNAAEITRAIDDYGDAQAETQRQYREAEKLFESLNLPDFEKSRSPYSREGVAKGDKTTREKLVSGLNGEVFNDRETRRKVFTPTLVTATVGALGGIGSAVVPAVNEAFVSSVGQTTSLMGFETAAAALVIGGITWASMKVFHSVRESQHQGKFTKLYGKRPFGTYIR
jgi:hypothetical protein